jgi:O-antigen ligase
LVRINLAKDITLHLIDISVFLIFITWIALQLINKKNILKIYTLKPVLLFSLICLISLLANAYWLKPNELVVSALYFLRWLSSVGVYFAVRDTKTHFKNKTLPRILVIDGLTILILGFIQQFFFPSLIGFYQPDWDRHDHRMFSVFLDPNYLGSFFVLYLLFIGANFFENLNKKKNKLTVLYGIISGATLVAVYLTYSRSALLMLLISSITFLTLINKKRIIFILIGATLVYVLITSPKFYIENLNLFRVNSSIERLQSAKIALQIIEKNPILGVGFNTYRYAQVKYNFRASNTNFTSHADAGTDNSFLFVAATTGILGLLSYLYIWFNLLKKAYQKSKEKNNFYAACILSSAIGLSVSGQVINSLFFLPLILWMWILIGSTDSK